MICSSWPVFLRSKYLNLAFPILQRSASIIKTTPTRLFTMDIDVQDEYRHLGLFYEAVASLLDLQDDVLFQANTDVSAWSPAQQLYHILRANGMMCKGIQLLCQGRRMTDEEGGMNKAGHYVLTKGFVRGRGKAPEAVVPPDDVSREVLQETLARSLKKYRETEAYLAQIPEAEGRMPHHHLGLLNASEWLRLARLHSEHHLAIIRDIVGAQAAA